ncbi:MAG TPA: ABC transporter ATP-binding protein, partial [Synergistaceae bacterium]|nr:ABC transporter ATP-binding protein [Synergistaceae bacterium]
FPRKEGISISSADVMDEQRVREMDESDDTVVAMKDVCLTVYEGETFIIMGLSGSG